MNSKCEKMYFSEVCWKTRRNSVSAGLRDRKLQAIHEEMSEKLIFFLRKYVVKMIGKVECLTSAEFVVDQ